MTAIVIFVLACLIGAAIGSSKAEKERSEQEYFRTHIKTNADFVAEYHDSVKVSLGQMSRSEFKRNQANGKYRTPIEQTYRDAIGSPQKIGEEPVRLCKIR